MINRYNMLVAALIAQMGQPIEFNVIDSYTCRNLCVDMGYWYFSEMDGRGGKCCSNMSTDEIFEKCAFNQGLESRGRLDMQYFPCP